MLQHLKEKSLPSKVFTPHGIDFGGIFCSQVPAPGKEALNASGCLRFKRSDSSLFAWDIMGLRRAALDFYGWMTEEVVETFLFENPKQPTAWWIWICNSIKCPKTGRCQDEKCEQTYQTSHHELQRNRFQFHYVPLQSHVFIDSLQVSGIYGPMWP